MTRIGNKICLQCYLWHHQWISSWYIMDQFLHWCNIGPHQQVKISVLNKTYKQNYNNLLFNIKYFIFLRLEALWVKLLLSEIYDHKPNCWISFTASHQQYFWIFLNATSMNNYTFCYFTKHLNTAHSFSQQQIKTTTSISFCFIH